MGRRRPRGSVARTSEGLLHTLNHLHRLNRRLVVDSVNMPRHSPAMRRARQRRAFAKQLVDANNLVSALGSKASGWWFWQGLRWGGPAMLIGWWLAQAARG